MMGIYDTINRPIVRQEPDVWIQRIVIYESLIPEPRVIRDISLTRGLNIVWAEEILDDETAPEITGHSAGKTTLCRLIRYCLGESTFGTKARQALIQAALPEGYVAAELFVRGKQWAVLRPFGKGRLTSVKANASVEELLDDRSQRASQENYAEVLGLNDTLSAIPTSTVVRTGERIRWGHILAWCTRDQEARYQNIYDWRSPRSESETPTFRFSKSGPLFVMRAVLGLFASDELKQEENLADKTQEREQLTSELEELKREPKYRENLYLEELRTLLGEEFPDRPGIADMPYQGDELAGDLEGLAREALESIRQRSTDLEDERQSAQIRIDELGAELARLVAEIEQADTTLDIGDAAAGEIEHGLQDSQKDRQKIKESASLDCPFGRVLVGNCKHVQDRLNLLDRADAQDQSALEQIEAEQASTRETVRVKRDVMATQHDEVTAEREQRIQERKVLDANISACARDLKAIEETARYLAEWMDKVAHPESNPALSQIRTDLATAESRILELEAELSTLLRKHDANRKLLAQIYSETVEAALPRGGYSGKVSFDERELRFAITHGPAMSGEAVETLSVLLADLTCLIYNSLSERSQMPGFLLHDSPREADLGLRLYHNFFRIVASLQSHFGDADHCPYQYIITTTTAPPKDLQSDAWVKLRLGASTPDELLLRRNVAEFAQGTPPGLFEQAPKADDAK